ncbi:MAG: phosphoglucosamine mutase [Ruminococcus sp.]|nr:phosphoglucosamine mutase [Ruminococcus sp.]
MGGIFGKDGIKAVAITELTCEVALQVGRAVAAFFAGNGGKILVGRDTRSSSTVLEAAVCAGITSMGADAQLIGAVPTPALTGLIPRHGAVCGIMIAASASAAEVNGIRVYGSDGRRITDEEEDHIEQIMPGAVPSVRRKYGSIFRYDCACEDYINRMISSTSLDLSGMRIAVDMANGAAALTALRIFRKFGAELVVTGSGQDGAVNASGCTHMEQMCSFVTENGCACGISFDGGGERCVAVDECGNIVDGDVITGLCARDMLEKGLLRNETIVVTQANNLGLRRFAADNGIGLSQASMGERSMIRRMTEEGLSLGGAPSGMLLFPDISPSADGQLTALKLLEALADSGRTLSDLASDVQKVPRVVVNVLVGSHNREVWKNDRAITGVIQEFEEILGIDGRVIVREFGKDTVIRIIVEGDDYNTITQMADKIAETIREQLGLEVPEEN